MLADRGSEGCESHVKYVEKENEDVVGSMNGYGMLEEYCDGGVGEGCSC